MSRIIVAGIGTEVGKTVVSAILTKLLGGDYWKPVQSGPEADTSIMQGLLDTSKHRIYPPAYSLKAPVSPHQAARLEGIAIDVAAIQPPETTRPLVIEGVGGVLVPLTANVLSLDLFKLWGGRWVIVSRHYLGSINHTLLTIEALKKTKVAIAGIIFNGNPQADSEEAILNISALPMLGRLLPEQNINSNIINNYVNTWNAQPFLL